MPHYKDPEGRLHYIDSPEFAYILPAGSVAITDEEADALRPPAGLPVASCSPWQICKALLQIGLLDDVEAAVAASGDRVLQLGWAKASEFRSDDHFVIAMGESIGKSQAETRDLIALASTL